MIIMIVIIIIISSSRRSHSSSSSTSITYVTDFEKAIFVSNQGLYKKKN